MSVLVFTHPPILSLKSRVLPLCLKNGSFRLAPRMPPDPRPSVITVGKLLFAIFLLGFGFRRVQITKLTSSGLSTHWAPQIHRRPALG